MPPVIASAIPSPDISSFSLGPLTIHFYALCILLGIAAAVWLTMRRWKDRNQDPEVLWDIVFWAVIAGIIGSRAYHVFITDPAGYFGPGADPLDALKIWEGGLGIMGGVLFGAGAAWLVSRKNGVPLWYFADSVAPSLLLAQGIGRWGNWFNQELFGRPTDLPWGLQIDPSGPNFPDGLPADTLFHPTFLYESLWNIAGVVILITLGRQLRLTHGRVFALYLVYYGLGRLLIELFLRIDPALLIAGQRVHVWTSLALVVFGIALFAAITAKVRRDPEIGAGATASSGHR